MSSHVTRSIRCYAHFVSELRRILRLPDSRIYKLGLLLVLLTDRLIFLWHDEVL